MWIKRNEKLISRGHQSVNTRLTFADRRSARLASRTCSGAWPQEGQRSKKDTPGISTSPLGWTVCVQPQAGQWNIKVLVETTMKHTQKCAARLFGRDQGLKIQAGNAGQPYGLNGFTAHAKGRTHVFFIVVG